MALITIHIDPETQAVEYISQVPLQECLLIISQLITQQALDQQKKELEGKAKVIPEQKGDPNNG